MYRGLGAIGWVLAHAQIPEILAVQFKLLFTKISRDFSTPDSVTLSHEIPENSCVRFGLVMQVNRHRADRLSDTLVPLSVR